MSKKAIALLDKMAKAKQREGRSHWEWQRMTVSDSKTGRMHYDRYLKHAEIYDQAEKELRALLGGAA